MLMLEYANPSLPYETRTARSETASLIALKIKVRMLLEQERQEELPTPAEQETIIEHMRQEVAKLDGWLEDLKSHIQQYRHEIQQETYHYETQPLAIRINRLGEFQETVKSKLERIAQLENKITSANAQLSVAREKLEWAKQKLEALKAGYYDLPLDQDPRLVSLEEAYQRAKKQQGGA